MTNPYIDHSVYPDLETADLPVALVTDEERADYILRICAAWDFDIFPEQETLDVLQSFREAFDKYPLSHSPAYHTCRFLFGWPSVERRASESVRLTFAILDRLEERAEDRCLGLV